MSAKKLGRFTAGLFVALGLALGGVLAAGAGANPAAAVTVDLSAASAAAAQGDYDWS